MNNNLMQKKEILAMIPRPHSEEYAEHFAQYIDRVPESGDFLALLGSQPDELKALVGSLSDEQASARPAPGEWSVKEVVGHICDSERIFAYRALRIARGDLTPLPGFDQDDFVRRTNFNNRSLDDLLEELMHQRRGNVVCFRSLTADELARRGTVRSHPASARAIIYILVGHVMHHIESLKVDYHIAN